MDKYDRSIHAREEAEKLDCDILVSTHETLLLDLDTESAYKHFMRHYPDLCILASRNGNRHVVVHLVRSLDMPTPLTASLSSWLSFERYINDRSASLLYRPRTHEEE